MKKLLIDKNDLNIPNTLSLIRLLLVIPLILLFSNINETHYRNYILLLLGLIVLTDNLDGYLARKLNQITEMGKLLDPLSDKVIVSVMVIFMYINGEIPEFYFWLVLFKTISVYTGGIIIYFKTGIIPSSDIFGKVSVMLLGIFLAWCIIDSEKVSLIYKVLLYLSTAAIFATLTDYCFKGIKILSNGKHEN